jgi:cytochrome-b5 reductase
MTQALHAILGSPSSDQESVSMLYGSKESTDILGKDLLDTWQKQHGDKFSVNYVLSEEPENSDWKGERGYITKELIQKHFPGPDEENIIIFVCGPPPMYNALCGPRDEKDEIKGILGEMGYKPEQVYKF